MSIENYASFDVTIKFRLALNNGKRDLKVDTCWQTTSRALAHKFLQALTLGCRCQQPSRGLSTVGNDELCWYLIAQILYPQFFQSTVRNFAMGASSGFTSSSLQNGELSANHNLRPIPVPPTDFNPEEKRSDLRLGQYFTESSELGRY